MNPKQRQDLDNYITGHYGEDQFREQSDCWPELTAHQEHWERHNCAYVYEYDPTDEGPEQSVARIILSTHTSEEIATESIEHRVASKLYDTIALGLKDSGIIEAMRLRGVRI